MNLDSCKEGQRLTITTFDRPLMVAAGAGSGKTFTLTRRIAYGLLAGEGKSGGLRSVDEVLAITFTVKAAAELRDRIRGLLREEGLVEESLKVDDAWVCTIGSMAARILRENAFEVGIDPAFEVVDEAEASYLRAEAVEQVLAHLEEGADPLLRAVVDEFGLKGRGPFDKGLLEYAQEVVARVRAMPEGFGGLRVAEPTAAPEQLMRLVLEAAREIQGAVREWDKPTATDEAFAAALEEGIEGAERWLAADAGEGFLSARFDAELYLDVLLGFPPSSEKYRAKKPDAEAFAAWREAYADVFSEARAALGARVAAAAVTLARLVEDAYARAKGSGRLDQGDLLRRCLDAFAEHPELSARYRERFRVIMVDEFQDTDKLQVAVIGALAQPGFANVCTVGDAQQSIYRFRGADVNVFFEYRDRLRNLSPDAQFPSLPHNFRSHGDVLALVDAIFGQPQVFGDEFLHLEAAGAVNATVDPMFGPDGPARIAVSVFQNDASHATVSSDEASRRCAREVADRFAQLRDAGARPGEMALLLGSMTRASLYQEALREAGLESIVAGGSGFGQSPEAQLVALLLRVAVNRDDTEALYPVLASELFAISDDALLALATTDAWAAGDESGYPRQSIARGFFGREEDGAFPLGADDRAALALTRRCLRSFVRHAVREGAASALRRLFADSGLADRLQLEGANGMARAGNFNKACVIVEGLERDGCGIADVSRRYSDYIALAKEAPGALACLDADFVRIMTVHTSKGLEFPHVAVAELKDGYPGGSAPSFFVENIGEATYVAAAWMPHGSWDKTAAKLRSWARALDEEGPAVPMEEPAEAERAFCTLPAARFGAALATYSAVQEHEEARRLMYVALTRASRSLQLVMRVSAKPEDGYGDTWVTGDVFDALGWPMGEGASISMVDFGGRAPARVTAERLLVEMQDDEMGEGEGALAGEEKVEDRGSDGARGQRADEGIVSETAATDISPVFLVPLREHAEDPVLVPRNFAREGFYSYTSLSGAHPHSDEAAVDTDEGLVLVDSEGAAVASEYRASTGRGALPGSESATALGTAFHRLAQQAIELSERGALFCPGEAAVEAQIQKESLSAGQQERLYRALTRWLGSDEAVRFASYEHRRAEVPFTVALGGFFLEGEIDGLADNGDGAAFLIDYKTGGRDDETPEQLDEKHRLQASCYAYALMRAGYESVEAHFLRIERPGTDNPRDPQIVPYHFEKTDLPALEALIIAKQREASV